MSTSKKLKFLVKRGDTGKIVRLEAGEEDQVFDLLELSRSALKFEEEAFLNLRKADDNKEISVVLKLRDLEPGTLLIVNDKNIEEEAKEKLKEKKAAINKENMANAEKINEQIGTTLNNNRNNPTDNYASFRDQFSQQGPTSSSNQHSLLNDLKSQVKSHDTAERSLKEKSELEEIRILNRKLNSEGLDGFVYEIIPESYTDYNESKYYESSFSSEDERKATQSKVSSTSDWSSWEARAGFSGWGVSVSASAGQSSSSEHSEGRKSQRSEKTRLAVVTRTSFHQMKKFRAKVQLSDKAIDDAKEILKTNMHEKRQAINEFNKKYCTLVYNGQFSAGGWFTTIATARSTEAMEFTALEQEASERTEKHWSVGFSGYGVTAGAGQNTGTHNQRNEHESRQSSKSSVSVTIRKESAPGNTSSENDLENKIKDAKNLCVFPITEAKKSDFTQVYEIMKSQAEEIGDKDLERVSDIIKLYMKVSLTLLMGNFLRPPYVVFLGDVGTGKSTVVEKLTGSKGRSSDANQSYTRSSEAFWVPDGSLIVSDTPGSNSMTDKLQHNIWIAGALNYRPVSRIFIVVKAEARMDSVVDNVRKYADRFVELPMDAIGVVVTHMDMVGWTKEEFTPHLDKELGIDTVVFSWINTAGETLLHDILETCTETHDLTVNSENFFKLFKIHNNHRRILKLTGDEVKNFQEKKKAFDEARKAFKDKDLVDLVFEFQAYMTIEITKAQQRFSEDNKFTFTGDGAANEAGHVANMVNQLRMVLYDIRTECVGFQSEHGVSELRKCPHCGLVWTKVEGCDGDTTCGRRPDAANDFRDSAFSVLATYAFQWVGNKLNITKRGDKNVKSEKNTSASSVGCGNTINWKTMATVSVPSEFSETVKVCVSDVKVLPPAASGFKKDLSKKLDQAQDEIKLSERPRNPGVFKEILKYKK